jgi:hypothetical protein
MASKTCVSRLQQGAVLDRKGFHTWDPIQIFFNFQLGFCRGRDHYHSIREEKTTDVAFIINTLRQTWPCTLCKAGGGGILAVPAH